VAKGEVEVYRPAEACRIAEVAPYVLRYWETEFPALSEGKDKGASKVYTARDVRIISRIRELLYDEGFTVAGAKKRLDAEITEGRFDDGLTPAPPVSEQRKAAAPAPAPSRKAEKPERAAAKAAAQPTLLSAVESAPAPRPAAPSGPPGLDRKGVVRELKEIVRMLDRSRAK
jgi:DNA-binding transcriptional MerR regulator